MKYGKRHSPQLCTAPPLATRPPPLDLDGEAASTECTDDVSAAETTPPCKSRHRPVRLNQAARPSKKRNLSSPSVDQRPPPPRKYTAPPLDKFEVPPSAECPPPKKTKKSTQLPPDRNKSWVSLDERLPQVSSPPRNSLTKMSDLGL